MTEENRNLTERNKKEQDAANRDPITGAPGAHPVGTGVGAAGGAVAGAAIGAIGGPIGAAVGLVAGAVAGGLTGKGVAEKMDPTVEEAYWKTNYTKRPYVDQDTPYDTYRTAYQTGYQGRNEHPGKTYDEVEAELRRNYEKSQGDANLTWDQAKQATRDAWDRLETVPPGASDADGR
jgi:uncharacterized protein YcfJ